ncbi:hypothetical protein [Endozoicomonas sp.]|uniref:hypothetical protein n=1 Tax=Endozoicomonas sp. TaxID=1892382 RepID=UPI00383A3958
MRLLSATGLQPLIKATPKGDNQNITTIELPLTDTNTAPGLIELGVLVEVQDIAGD